MSILDVLDSIEVSRKPKEKVEILSKHKDNKELTDLLTAALSFSRKFYIKKISLPESFPARSSRSHDEFMSLLDQLENREITGNAAYDAVSEFLSQCNEQQATWYERVIKKDLRSGLDVATANKAGFNIPKFDVMLAKDGEGCKSLESIVAKGAFVSPKLDGYRCIAECSHGQVTLYSRNGTIYENFPSVIETLSGWCTDSEFVLDGEIMSDDFNSMQQSAFASKRGTVVGDVSFHVFGLIPYEEWQSGNFIKTTSERLTDLKTLFSKNQVEGSNIKLVDQSHIHTVEDIKQLEEDFIKAGFEGAMLLPDIPYYLGRKSNRLMKFKIMKSQDCEVTGLYEGTGKYKNSLGGFTVTQEDGVKQCDVGSGFTDADRKYIWKNKFDFIGRIAEIKYQELTPDGIMRFPIFVRWRDRGVKTGKI